MSAARTANSASGAKAEALQVLQVAVADIAPSLTNPRKSFDEAQLAELAASIKIASGAQDGTKFYEIVGGERRWRAAAMAGLETVPAIVREMTDAAPVAALAIHKLHPKKVQPLSPKAQDLIWKTRAKVAKAVRDRAKKGGK